MGALHTFQNRRHYFEVYSFKVETLSQKLGGSITRTAVRCWTTGSKERVLKSQDVSNVTDQVKPTQTPHGEVLTAPCDDIPRYISV